MLHEWCLVIRDVHTTRHATILFCRFAGPERQNRKGLISGSCNLFLYTFFITSMRLDAYCELQMPLTKEKIVGCVVFMMFYPARQDKIGQKNLSCTHLYSIYIFLDLLSILCFSPHQCELFEQDIIHISKLNIVLNKYFISLLL